MPSKNRPPWLHGSGLQKMARMGIIIYFMKIHFMFHQRRKAPARFFFEREKACGE